MSHLIRQAIEEMENNKTQNNDWQLEHTLTKMTCLINITTVFR